MSDSALGRFIQPDTLTAGGPQGLNRYAYTMGNPVNGTDPTGHKACDDEYGCDPLPLPDHAPTIPTIPPDPPIDDKPKNDNAVKGLKIAATVTQDIATLIDGVWAGAEVGVLIAASTGWPETIPEVILGMDVLYNVYGGNAAENAFSGLSLLFTGLADLRSGNRLGGENFLTSASTFGAGTLMQDPIGDFAIDAYASSYTHGILNGVQTIINGGPIWKGIWKWY